MDNALEVTDATDLLLLVHGNLSSCSARLQNIRFPTLCDTLFWFSFAAAFTDTGIISMLTNKQHIRITDRFINLFILFSSKIFLNYNGFYQNCIGRSSLFTLFILSHGLPSPDPAPVRYLENFTCSALIGHLQIIFRGTRFWLSDLLCWIRHISMIFRRSASKKLSQTKYAINAIPGMLRNALPPATGNITATHRIL